jgi:tetratricopeptide (TPR) repeat protein
MPLFSRNGRQPSVISRADRAREAGQWQVAAGFYRMALDRKPRNPPIWVQYGHALKECGSPAEAEGAYRTAIRFEPDDADAHLHLGHVLKLQGKTAEAQAAYQRALALDGSLTEAARELSLLDRREQRLREEPPPTGLAIPARGEPLAIATVHGSATQPKFAPGKGSFISQADCARDARQWEIAADLYRKALDRNPNNPPIWVQYGHALKEAGRLAEAESAYRAAIALNGSAAEPYLQLGHVLKMRGRHGEAQTAYLQAFALQPSMSEPLSGLDSLGWPDQQIAQLTAMLAGALPDPKAGRRQPGRRTVDDAASSVLEPERSQAEAPADSENTKTARKLGSRLDPC